MVFSSITFLFVFFPLFLFAYALLPWRNFVALIFSLIFYAWGEGLYVGLLLATVFVNYIFGLIICRGQWRKQSLILGVSANLLLLGYFKYYGFVVADILGLNIAIDDFPHLPLGISFFIFQSISYLVDIYRGDARGARSFADLALYIAMFPQLIAGPIVRYASVAEAIQQRYVSFDGVSKGIAIFILGLSYKVLISNNVAEMADASFGTPLDQVDVVVAWVGALAYTLQIYFDFAGYSLMAIGIGKMMGFEFPENFNYPYIATSITDFWRRWHMSLSSWFRDYLYIPLGGNQKGVVRTYINLFAVFFLCGLWHGAAWTYVAWGMFHGFVLVIERAGLKKVLDKLPNPLSLTYTLLLVVIGWVLFRAESFEQARVFLAAMFGLGSDVITPIWSLITNENLTYFIIGAILSMPFLPWCGRKLLLLSWIESRGIIFYSASSLLCASLFLVCAMYIMAGTYNPFIYFRF